MTGVLHPVGADRDPGVRRAGRRFRPEVEGLRAVAALLVAVYHVFLGRVSGGVDVFFVVAGFLITTTLLGHLAGTGRVQAMAFLGRLAGRLVPIATLVLLSILVASLAWLPVTRLGQVLREIVASAVYLQNWALARQSVDYLARGEAMSPVQHFWALSIQGQFYVVWLVLFAAVGLLALRARRDPRTLLAAALGVVAVGSFAFSIFLTARNQPLAYFHTGTRMWEFAAGGLLALALPRLTVLGRLPPWAGAAAGWAGLALILSCGLVITVSSSFPGWIALWPVTGGLLVILAGDAPGAASRWSSTRLLGSRLFVFLGGVSYALYLWHWPILTFYRSRAGEGPVELLPGLAIIALSVVLAVVSTRLVERPIRTQLVPRIRPWQAVAAGGLALVLVAGTSFAFLRISLQRASAAVETGGVDYPGAAAMVPGFVYRGRDDVPVAPDLLQAQTDRPLVFANGCHQKLAGEDGAGTDGAAELARALRDERCSFGDPDGEVTAVLLGGSHAAQWFPALRGIAEDSGWHLVSATKSGCRFSADPQGDHDEGRSCVAWNEAALQALVARPPDLVFTTSTVTSPGGEHVEDGFLTYWHVLAEAGIEVVAIRDTPRWASSPLDCVGINTDDPSRCWTPASRSMAAVDPTTALPDPPPGVTFVDLTDLVCRDDRCPAVIGNVVAYYDANHLSATFVRTMTPMLDERLARAGR